MFRKHIKNLFGRSGSSRSLASRELRIERCEDRCMLASHMADIVFAIDESSSAAETSSQAWVAKMIAGDAVNGVASLATQLENAGIDDVRHALAA